MCSRRLPILWLRSSRAKPQSPSGGTSMKQKNRFLCPRPIRILDMLVHRGGILYGVTILGFIGNLAVFVILNVVFALAQDGPLRFRIALGQSQSSIYRS